MKSVFHTVIFDPPFALRKAKYLSCAGLFDSRGGIIPGSGSVLLKNWNIHEISGKEVRYPAALY
ncbi:MAG TPA: hypothetical protein VJ161_02835, partial [Geobacteraceae bacterium]|nr:hypothetical protein [Geobacteraceae bacterium]